MTQGTKLRDLFVRLGFEIDDGQLDAVDRSLKNVTRSAKQLSIFMAAGSAAIAGVVNEGAKLEQVEIAFETMLGSAEKSKEILDDLFQFARTTPFTIPGILDGSKRLLAMGIEADRLIDTMSILGNITAGVGTEKMPQLILALGQVKAATKLRGQELRQFTEAGVPLLAELGKSLGKTPGEVQELVSKGEVSFEAVRKALENLTTGSGRFANLMEKQSKSFLGILSNIQDFIIILAQGIGKELLPQAKAIANQFLEILETNRELIKTKFINFFKDIAKILGRLFKIVKQLGESILFVANAFGGLGNVIKTVVLAMLAFTAINVLSALGNIALLVLNIAKGFKAVGIAATLANAKILLLPILLGAAIIALGLLIEDVIAFFQGKASITGLILDAFEKKFPIAFAVTKMALEDIIQGFKFWFDIAKTTINGIIGMLADVGNAILSPLDSLEKFAKNLNELATATFHFPGENVQRKYLDYRIQKDGKRSNELIDPFGNPYSYNPQKGWVRSMTKQYEYW